MKKLFLALTIFAATGLAAVNAAPKEEINSKAARTFQKDFAGASDVRWSVSDEVVKANFTYLNARTEAYFNMDGELIGTARNVLYNELPLAVTKEIEKRYGAAGVYEIAEYFNSTGTGYMMTVDLGKKKLQVRSTASGDVWVVKRIN